MGSSLTSEWMETGSSSSSMTNSFQARVVCWTDAWRICLLTTSVLLGFLHWTSFLLIEISRILGKEEGRLWI